MKRAGLAAGVCGGYMAAIGAPLWLAALVALLAVGVAIVTDRLV